MTSNTVRTLWVILTLPATILHELAHAVVAMPAAEQVGIAIEPRGCEAHCLVAWREDASRFVIIASALAPPLAGLLAAGVAVWQWTAVGGPTPRSVTEWALLSIVATYWWVFVTPSPDDIQVAREAGHDRDD